MRPPPVAPDAFGEVESYGKRAPSSPLRGRSCQSYLSSTRELGKAVDGHPHKLPKSQKIDGLRPQFLGGVCRIPLASLESLRETYSECFDYNRDPMSYQGRAGTRENSHHGNLLILNAQTKATKAAKKNIVAVLAYMASPPQSDVYSRNELDKLLEGIS